MTVRWEHVDLVALSRVTAGGDRPGRAQSADIERDLQPFGISARGYVSRRGGAWEINIACRSELYRSTLVVVSSLRACVLTSPAIRSPGRRNIDARDGDGKLG